MDGEGWDGDRVSDYEPSAAQGLPHRPPDDLVVKAWSPRTGHVCGRECGAAAVGEVTVLDLGGDAPRCLLVTEEDMTAALHAGVEAVERLGFAEGVDYAAVELRAQLEEYGQRLLARIGWTA